MTKNSATLLNFMILSVLPTSRIVLLTTRYFVETFIYDISCNASIPNNTTSEHKTGTCLERTRLSNHTDWYRTANAVNGTQMIINPTLCRCPYTLSDSSPPVPAKFNVVYNFVRPSVVINFNHLFCAPFIIHSYFISINQGPVVHSMLPRVQSITGFLLIVSICTVFFYVVAIHLVIQGHEEFLL